MALKNKIIQSLKIAGIVTGIALAITHPIYLDYVVNGPYERTVLEEINPPGLLSFTGLVNENRDNSPRVFDYENKDKIIIRTSKSPAHWLGVDLIGSRQNGFEYAKIPAPVRGLGVLTANSHHPHWEKFKATYNKLFEEYESR